MGLRSGALSVLLLAAVPTTPAAAEDVNAAVAANFTSVATDIAAAFEKNTGNHVNLSFGATGALYTQITQGAPLDVFLSADDKRTAQAIREGFGVEGTDFTYAMGRLVLYSPSVDLINGAAVLTGDALQHLAIADPKAAPYGAAAMEVLGKLGLLPAIAPKIVTGESITQTLQFVESGNAAAGFVALSQVMGKPAAEVWVVPQEDYTPIQQNAVLLTAAANKQAARAFLDYLRSDEAKRVIEAAGYALE